ncbi:putative WD domain-containing protein [Colletotrichum sublineola]|uniref:Putative WD domain-containing protein n=1 Tax=Colletotrichum sublineola TaxID=1173701 RepID=A0A066XVA3_COLSU|nr:putative WD domain-containing protein [Colletotrichum sublineola]
MTGGLVQRRDLVLLLYATLTFRYDHLHTKVEPPGYNGMSAESFQGHTSPPYKANHPRTEEIASYGNKAESCNLESDVMPILTAVLQFVGIAATCRSHSLLNASNYAVKLESPRSFVGTEDSNLNGVVSFDFTYLTAALLADTDIELQVVCSITEEVLELANSEKRFRGPNLMTKCSLEIILYGQGNHSDDISLFIDQCNELLEDQLKLYLQDPVGCDRNVRYCNPQRLPPLDSTIYPYTQDLEQKRQSFVKSEDLEPPPELLELLDSQEDLPEALQPPAIATPLKRHQKQALTFMLRREQGWAFDGTRPDIWGAEETEMGIRFINRISGARQAHEPPAFYGGIIADPMGFGKTLAMITLVASDSYNTALSDAPRLPGALGEESCGLTLIVVPPALLGTWEEELTNDSKMARAVCALDSVSRWAVTGTPIQNHLNDLATLLKFLSAYPYNEKRVFDADISHMWKAGDADKAVKRLKRLAGCLLLRRPRKTVELPPRHDRAYYVELQPDERELYNRVRTQTIAQIDQVLLHGSHGTSAPSSFTVLQQIVGMRLVCNLGLFYPSRHDTSILVTNKPTTKDWSQTAQSEFSLRFNEMGSIDCHRCAFTLDAAYSPLDDPGTTNALFSRCAKFFCSGCVRAAVREITTSECGHQPPCPIAPVSISAASLETAPIPMPIEQIAGSGYLPTKVATLIEDLQATPSDVKCVVFSTWTMTLDIVKVGLDQAGIPVLRYDGKVPQKERQRVVERFRNEPSIRVLLLTLSCGAVGLNLTAASRAYLMEPNW